MKLNRRNKPTIGIIGRGNFAQLLKKILKPYARSINLIGRDSSESERLKVFTSDIVILSVTFDKYKDIIGELKKNLRPDSLLVDVCSVKVMPTKFLKKHLPDHKNLLLTHPLFGPQSAKKDTKGLRLIVTKSNGDSAKQLLEFCRTKLKLNIINMSAADHDKAMAYTHSLTFFVSQALHPFKLEGHGITTPSFKELLDLSNIAKNESKELLLSIHNDNPYAKAVREKFSNQVKELMKSINE